LVTPQVTIMPNPAGPVCQGTAVTFTASPVSGGAAPYYEWLINGVAAGGNSPVFSSNALNDGDLLKVRMTSGANCPSPASVNSNTVVMNINPVVVPAVGIAATPAGPICQGTPVTFTALPVNEGNAPIFQWRVNGLFAGFGSSFTTSTLSDGDSITVRLNSNAVCAVPQVVFSVPYIAQVFPYLAPFVTISAAPSLPVCDGDTIYFSATGSNGGATPGYQWLLNGQPAGTNSDTFSDQFDDGDIVSVVYTSSYQCPLAPADSSATITAAVMPNLTPEVTINVNPQGPVCPGDVLTFSALPVNGGATPSFQWLVNGAVSGSNSPVFVSGTLNDGDIVKVVMTSSGPCLTTPTDISNAITIQINPTITPVVTIGVAPAFPVCAGDSLTFTASFTGSGTSPSFSWRVNGVSGFSTGSQFITNQLLNGDAIDVVMQSSAFCALPSTDTSNRITAIINPLLSPSASIVADPPGTFCDGAVITYSATGFNGGSSPSWQWLLNGLPTGTGNDTLVSAMFMDGDTLQAIYTSSEECLSFNPAYSNQLVIDRLPPLQPVITAPDNICFGQEVHLTAQVTGGNGGPYFLSMDNGLGSGGDFTFIPAQTATYTLTASDSCSTPRQVSVTIVVNPLPQPAFSYDPENPDILNSVLEFSNQSSPASGWTWDFGDGSGSAEEHPTHTYTNPGYYPVTLVVTSDAGCTDSLTREVYVRNVVTFYIPNSFTPNGDGINDLFSLTGNAVSGYEMVIYGRWGQEIFRSSGINGWDGLDTQGKEAQAGVYVYVIRVFNDPEQRTIRGTITLIR
jgi:gliding motility-associated-like protein